MRRRPNTLAPRVRTLQTVWEDFKATARDQFPGVDALQWKAHGEPLLTQLYTELQEREGREIDVSELFLLRPAACEILQLKELELLADAQTRSELDEAAAREAQEHASKPRRRRGRGTRRGCRQ